MPWLLVVVGRVFACSLETTHESVKGGIPKLYVVILAHGGRRGYPVVVRKMFSYPDYHCGWKCIVLFSCIMGGKGCKKLPCSSNAAKNEWYHAEIENYCSFLTFNILNTTCWTIYDSWIGVDL